MQQGRPSTPPPGRQGRLPAERRRQQRSARIL